MRGVPYQDIEQLVFEAEYCYPDKSQYDRVNAWLTNYTIDNISKILHPSTRRVCSIISRLWSEPCTGATLWTCPALPTT